MSESTSTSKSEEKPKRNPVERLVVWGGIGIMIVIACVEGVARYGYTTTLPLLQSRMAEDDVDADSQALSLVEAEKLIAGFPSRTVEGKKVIFRWKGLVKDHGAIHLTIDDEDNVYELETDAPPEVDEPAPPVADDSEDDEATAGGGGGPGGGGQGPGGGFRDFDPMQFDADGDGKLSLEEAPERMKALIGNIDANQDGFADAEEVQAFRDSRRGGRDGEGGGRPQRPDTEESTTSETTESDSESAEAKREAEEKAEEE